MSDKIYLTNTADEPYATLNLRILIQEVDVKQQVVVQRSSWG